MWPFARRAQVLCPTAPRRTLSRGMPELLTGTVTFLFSDIEGSTRLPQSHGEAWSSILARHQELLRTAFAAEGGVEVGTEGDSFFVTFPTASGSVAAAVAAQRAIGREPWPDDAYLRVRMGMHTGEARFGTEDYVGLDVHRASRITSVGHGGQILLSDTTRSLVGEALPDGVELRDLGLHRLKDLDRPERLWQIVVVGAPNVGRPARPGGSPLWHLVHVVDPRTSRSRERGASSRIDQRGS